MANFEKIIKENIDKVDIFNKMFKSIFLSIFTNAKDRDFKFVDKYLNKNNINLKNMYYEFVVFTFEYYKRFEKFDGIIFINHQNGKYIIVENSKDFLNNIEKFNFSGGINFNGNDNEITPKITYKG